MKTLVLMCFCILFFQLTHCQDLKREVVDDHGISSIFFFDKKSKLKEGAFYKISDKTADTLTVGQYKNDKKVGIWRYRGQNKEKYLEYDFINRKMLFLTSQFFKPDTFLIKNENNEFETSKIDSPPIYLGYRNEFEHQIFLSLVVPIEVFEAQLQGITIASFVIDTCGRMKDIKIEKSIHKEMDKKIMVSLKSLEKEWIPAVKSSKPVEAKVYLFVVCQEINSPHIKVKSLPYSLSFYLKYSAKSVRRTF